MKLVELWASRREEGLMALDDQEQWWLLKPAPFAHYLERAPEKLPYIWKEALQAAGYRRVVGEEWLIGWMRAIGYLAVEEVTSEQGPAQPGPEQPPPEEGGPAKSRNRKGRGKKDKGEEK